jgi:hypothetical protein
MAAFATTNGRETPRAFGTIVWGGTAAGILDLGDALTFAGIHGIGPITALQYVSSGAMGNAAFEGGWATAAFGAILHFVIAFVVAAAYYAASRCLVAVRKNPAISGLAFGAAVYLFMFLLVLPLSAVPKAPFSLASFLNGVLGHSVFVGLPIAWFAHRSADRVTLRT